jgi:alanyl-tRNA synthetase
MKKTGITRDELVKKYIDFFKSKGHKEIPNSSLVPENDPTVLFTTAGMHPLVPFLLGQPHALGKRLCNVQKCIRTGDIEEVGDDFHLTFFEMLGNWSIGDYWKKEAINWSLEFLTKELKIPAEELIVSVFKGDKDAPKDEESAKIWKSLGIKENQIKFLSKKDNWWGPAGNTGPCGPDTEMFVNECEIWNDVFMQYVKDEKGDYNLAKQKNVDTGMGVERVIAILTGKKSVYETEIFQPIIKSIEEISGKSKLTNNISARIIADHIKAATFMSMDGVVPSNVERGYVLRRIIRRAVRHGHLLGIKENFTTKLVGVIIKIYEDSYPELNKRKSTIFTELEKEENRFKETLEAGLREFEKRTLKLDTGRNTNKSKLKIFPGTDAFLLYQSYGFPLEVTIELAKEKGVKVELESFKKALERHQELSRTASAGTFKSGLADNTEQTKKLHTATHLLNEALRKVLGDENVKQKGSNINPERLRFDFNFGRKLTEEEIKKIEEWVNEKIRQSIDVKREEMLLEKALKSGAQAEFGAKYPEIVSVYTIGEGKNIVGREICTGPHVSNTKELGRFKIIKEESSAAGIRRIKAILDSK